MNRRGKYRRVFVTEHLRLIPFEDQFNEAFVMRMNQKYIERKRPEHSFSGFYLRHDLVELMPVMLDVSDLLGNVDYFQVMLWIHFCQERDELHGNAEIPLGASVQDKNFHGNNLTL